MASAYPAALDNFGTGHVDAILEIIHASDVNDIADAVNKIEAALGTNPQNVAFSLSASTIAGATSLTLGQSPGLHISTQSWVLIDAFTAQAELKKVTAVAGRTLTVPALTYAHAAGDVVLVINTSFLITAMWGCKGDGNVDDEIGLQEATFQCQQAGLVLDWQNKSHATTLPILCGQSAEWQRFSLKAKTTFAPADANNSMVMCYQGAVRSFTADPATDIITCSAAHGIPADGIPVVFKGTNLPAGLTAGRVYYAYNRTATTFKVSASLGGSIIDITSAGSGGTVYCEVHSLTKAFMREGVLDCNAVVGLNGIFLPVQQQSVIDQFRVNNATGGYGMAMSGQQVDARNIEIINCDDSIIFDNMSFLYLKDLNCEQFSSSAMKTEAIISLGGLTSSHILGIHFESRDTAGVYADFTSVVVINSEFSDGSMSGFNTDTAAWVGFDFGSTGSSYRIRGIRFPQGTTSAPSAIAVSDTSRGKTVHVWNDTSGTSCNREIAEIIAPNIPTSNSYHDEYGGVTIWGSTGTETRIGTTRGTLAWRRTQAGAGDTGNLDEWRDSSGALGIEITKDGYLKVGSGTAQKAEAFGATSVADGGTVTHGLGATPVTVCVTPSVAGEMVSVTALSSTTFTVAIKKHDGTAGTTQTVYWRTIR